MTRLIHLSIFLLSVLATYFLQDVSWKNISNTDDGDSAVMFPIKTFAQKIPHEQIM